MSRTNLYKIIKQLVSLLVISLVLLLIFNQFKEKITDLPAEFELKDAENHIWLILALLFLPINWLLETYKWHILINKVQKMSFIDCLKSILYGVSFGIITPNRIGEFGGKLILIKKQNRKKALFLGMYSSMIQQSITLLFGILALIWLFNSEKYTLPTKVTPYFYLVILAVLISVLFILITFKKRILGWMRKYEDAIRTNWSVARGAMKAIVGLSFIRYLVFTFQFIMVLQYLEIGLNWKECFLIISLIYFINSFFPSGLLIGLGIRTSAAVFLFGLYGANLPAALAATIIIWIMNLFVPGVIGVILMKDIKVPKLQFG